jgi:copper transport protein
MAVLPLLDRFSPVAYLAVAVLALSGLYNAVNHLDAPARLADTTYGQLLVLKLLLVGLLLLLSASHVWRLRPHMVRLHRKGHRDTHAVAGVHEGLATLAARLRLETSVGAAILLATALMGQTLPPTSTPSAAVAPSGAVPAAISGTAVTGDLRAQLTVAPPALGTATFTLQIWEKGTPITGDTGAAIIHLTPAAQPNIRASLTPTAHGTRFRVRGSLATTGAWRADVLVRTATVNEYRTLRFAFTVGPGAGFLQPGQAPERVTLQVTPGACSSSQSRWTCPWAASRTQPRRSAVAAGRPAMSIRS